MNSAERSSPAIPQALGDRQKQILLDVISDRGGLRQGHQLTMELDALLPYPVFLVGHGRKSNS
jgi:hypothetical protein